MAKKTHKSLSLAISPRGVAALVLVLAFVVATALLGRWQWDRTQGILEAERATKAQRVPVEQVLPLSATDVPADAMGHRVTLRGRWVADKQVAVVNREGDGKPGVWIVTALHLASGPTVGVVRGWLPRADSPGAVAQAGLVVVEAVVQADENFYASAVSAPGTAASIRNLSEIFGQPMLPGYVVLTSEEPLVIPAPIPVPAQVSTDVPFPLRNFVYALQWWLFGLFAVAVFVRWLWRDNDVH